MKVDRQSDGLILCENNDDYGNSALETLKMKIRKYHTEVTGNANSSKS